MNFTLQELKKVLEKYDLAVIKKRDLKNLMTDLYIHEYESYEQYRDLQIFHNKQKIDYVWADERTLNIVIQRVKSEFHSKKLKGLCHGTRNGFEQNFFAERMDINITGTDISETALDYPLSVQWDFHDENPQWIEAHDFIYTNSLDQSWQPKVACTTWLNQLKVGGLLFIEHTMAHSPEGASEMDPFGVKPVYFPYILIDWFGHFISIEVIKSVKGNMELEVWLFVIKKLISGKVSY